MTKPQDIEREPWTREPSQGWTNAAFRAPVLVFMKSYVAVRSWAESFDVAERFTDTGVNVRVQRGPALLHDNTPADQFKQRTGLRFLVLGATRVAKADFGGARRFEVSIDFPEGVMTPQADFDLLLLRAAQSLDAAYRKDRGLP